MPCLVVNATEPHHLERLRVIAVVCICTGAPTDAARGFLQRARLDVTLHYHVGTPLLRILRFPGTSTTRRIARVVQTPPPHLLSSDVRTSTMILAGPLRTARLATGIVTKSPQGVSIEP